MAEPRRKKPGTGRTAFKHALAICAERYPGLPLITAGKRVFWILDKQGNRIPRTASEDIHGVFDIACLFSDPPVCIQVTTQTKTRSSVSHRKRKILAWIKSEPYVKAQHGFGFGPGVEIWAWVPRAHMRCWVLRRDFKWVEDDPIQSPGFGKRES